MDNVDIFAAIAALAKDARGSVDTPLQDQKIAKIEILLRVAKANTDNKKLSRV